MLLIVEYCIRNIIIAIKYVKDSICKRNVIQVTLLVQNEAVSVRN